MTNEGKPFPCMWCRKLISTNEDYFAVEEALGLTKLLQGLHWNCVYEIATDWLRGKFGTDDLKGPKKPHHKYRGKRSG